MNYHLAIDIGASSGRHILGWTENGLMHMEEIHRFTNGVSEKNGHLCWDLEHLSQEVIAGIAHCATINKIPSSIAIDTWGCDFVLLDEREKILGDCIAYRDHRTQGVDVELYKVCTEEELYARTGIQKMIFNTIYQLYSLKLQFPELLAKAQRFLMIPDYLNCLLTGVCKNEYTNATTTQMINVNTNKWDKELLEKLGIPTKIFTDPELPSTTVGSLSAEIAAKVGFNAEVILCASHYTGSAVMAVPSQSDDEIYLSSGTWSLMGIERQQADSSELSRSHNFTNEGGYNYRFRYLKNLMGMWMLQNLRKEFPQPYSFKEQYALAAEAVNFPSTVDVNDKLFLAPESMSKALRIYCRNSGQIEPQSTGELLYCVYHSLALSYDKVIKEIEEITSHSYDCINVIGGGCQDLFLNRLTALTTGKKIKAGPIEGTAIGNLLCQMIKSGEYSDLKAGRAAIAKSFAVQEASTDLAKMLA